jgi:hypothetical protein
MQDMASKPGMYCSVVLKNKQKNWRETYWHHPIVVWQSRIFVYLCCRCALTWTAWRNVLDLAQVPWQWVCGTKAESFFTCTVWRNMSGLAPGPWWCACVGQGRIFVHLECLKKCVRAGTRSLMMFTCGIGQIFFHLFWLYVLDLAQGAWWCA